MVYDELELYCPRCGRYRWFVVPWSHDRVKCKCGFVIEIRE